MSHEFESRYPLQIYPIGCKSKIYPLGYIIDGVYNVAATFRIVIPASRVRTPLDTPLDILVKR